MYFFNSLLSLALMDIVFIIIIIIIIIINIIFKALNKSNPLKKLYT